MTLRQETELSCAGFENQLWHSQQQQKDDINPKRENEVYQARTMANIKRFCVMFISHCSKSVIKNSPHS